MVVENHFKLTNGNFEPMHKPLSLWCHTGTSSPSPPQGQSGFANFTSIFLKKNESFDERESWRRMRGQGLELLVLLGESIWVFPKIMVPPNHPLKNRVFHFFHHPFWGNYPYFGETPILLEIAHDRSAWLLILLFHGFCIRKLLANPQKTTSACGRPQWCCYALCDLCLIVE